MQREIDPELVVPDPTLSISEGALVPWTVINASFYEQVIQAIADRYEIDLETPWEQLPEEQRELFLHGTGGDKLYISYRNSMGRKRSYMLAFEGILPSLDRRYKETDSEYQKERLEEYMSLKPCPLLPRRPPQGHVARGDRRRHQHRRASPGCRWRPRSRSWTAFG